MRFFHSNTTKFIFFTILLVYAVIEVMFINSQSITADEGNHLNYGILIIKGNASKESCTPFDSKMPISVLNAIPRGVQQLFNPGLQKTDYGNSDVIMGRYVTLLLSFISLVIVFVWTRELYGTNAGLFSMFLLAICPTWLAHSGLVTTDAYSASVFLLVFYSLHKYFSTRRFIYFVTFCICLGLAQVIKQTFVYLYFCVVFFVPLYAKLNNIKLTLKKVCLHSIWLIAISLLIINGAFLFHQTGQSFNEYVFVSRMFNNLQQAIGSIGNVPLPLPTPYFVGMDTVKFFDEYGGGWPDSTYPAISILYNTEPAKSYWYYYLLSFLFKTPLPSLIFMTIAVFYLFKKGNRGFLVQKELILLVPVVFFFLIMTFFNHIQLGIRHLLFIYPLLYILCGKVFVYWVERKKLRYLLIGCTVWLSASIAYYLNAYMSYTNELVLNKTMAYQLVSVMNIDYGQSSYFAQQYIREHPGVAFAPKTPASGTFLISPGEYTDHFNYHEYNWIQKYKPVGHVNFCYLIIEVP